MTDESRSPRTEAGQVLARNLRTLNLTADPDDDWPEVDILAIEAAASRQSERLEERAAFLADLAARAVAEPRLFHEDANRQHDLGVATADVRRALAEAAAPRSGEGLDPRVLARVAYEDRPPTGSRPVPWTPVIRKAWEAWARRLAARLRENTNAK